MFVIMRCKIHSLYICGVLCVVCGVCGAAWHAQNPRVYAQNVTMCRFKTPPCVRAKRAHVSRFPSLFLCLSLSPCGVVCRCSRGVVGGRGVCLCVAAR